MCSVLVNDDMTVTILVYRFCGYLITNVPDVSIRDIIIVSK